MQSLGGGRGGGGRRRGKSGGREKGSVTTLEQGALLPCGQVGRCIWYMAALLPIGVAHRRRLSASLWELRPWLRVALRDPMKHFVQLRIEPVLELSVVWDIGMDFLAICLLLSEHGFTEARRPTPLCL